MLRFYRVAPLILYVAAGSSQAHNSLPSENWCLPGREVVAAHVVFSFSQVQNYANCAPAIACSVPAHLSVAGRAGVPDDPQCEIPLLPEDSCGEFDDDYSLVRRMTDSFCQRYAQVATGAHVQDWGSVVADVITPLPTANADPSLTWFYDANLHHSYVIGQQIELMCLRCEDPTTDPTD